MTHVPAAVCAGPYIPNPRSGRGQSRHALSPLLLPLCNAHSPCFVVFAHRRVVRLVTVIADVQSLLLLRPGVLIAGISALIIRQRSA